MISHIAYNMVSSAEYPDLVCVNFGALSKDPWGAFVIADLICEFVVSWSFRNSR